MKNIIMSWSKVKILLGKMGVNEAFASVLMKLGVINDKSTSLSVEDGETLEAKATGNVTVAIEEGEPSVSITTRVKEMDFATEAALIKGELNQAGDELVVKSNVIDEDYSVKVVPKNKGAIGIKARRTHVSFRPGYSEEEGHYVDVTFKILPCSDGELYTKFRVKKDDLADVATPVITATDNTIGVACSTQGATLEYKIGDGDWTAYSAAITATADNNGKTLSARATSNGQMSSVATHTIVYTA